MRIKLVVPALLLMLAACATPFRSEVARFHQMPAPQGQTFTIQSSDPKMAGGLEFSQYASLVRDRLIAQGYQPAGSADKATLVVDLDYGVNNGREKIDTRPGSGFSGYGWGGYPYGFGPWGGWYGRRAWGGWYDPFWGPGWGGDWGAPEVYSYTVFNSFLDMKITRASDGTRLFEGRAESQTRDSNLTRLVPNLVEAMFTNFPGRSGETVKVKVEPPSTRG
jgi:hypothetical protein